MTKQELREILKKKRASIPREQKAEMDEKLVQVIGTSRAFAQAKAILLYAPIGSEADLMPLVEKAQRAGKTVAFPKCNTETCTMDFYVLEQGKTLPAGAYGIPEPSPDAPLFTPDEHTLCILPALTFDPAGRRLGYGKGYYDRFLATFKGVTAGAVYRCMMLRRVPTQPHDIPVSLVFTEAGVLIPKREEASEGEKQKDPPVPPKKGERREAKPFGARVKNLLRKAMAWIKGEGQEGQTEAVRPAKRPPLLVCACFVLLLISKLIDTHISNRENELIVVILLQLLIFVVPVVVYGRMRGKGFFKKLRVTLPRPDQLWLMACILMLMISGGLLCSIFTGGIGSLTQNFTLYDTFVAHLDGSAFRVAAVILAYGVLPAFCEELVFRSVLCAEYEGYGVGISAAVSGVMFAMLHFSFPMFLTYLFLGVLLALTLYATRSFLAVFVLHLCYNLFCLFGRPYLSMFYVTAGSNEIFLFCLGVIFLLFGAFAAGEARKIYHRYAKANLDSSYTVSVPWREWPRRLWQAVFTPTVIPCVAIWLIMAVVNLF